MHVFHRVVSLYCRSIHNMYKRLRSLHMAKELYTQTYALACALHYTRYIRKDKIIAVFKLYNAEIRSKCSKVIIGYFGVGVCNHRKKCRLTYIGKSYKSDVGNKLKLQNDVIFLGFLSHFRISGSLSCRCGKVLISSSASSASDNDLFLSVFGYVRHNLVCRSFLYDRSLRNLDYKVFPVLTETVSFSAVLSRFCLIHSFVSEVHQSIHIFITDKNNASSFSAVSAVRTSVGYIFRSVKRNAAVAAVSALYVDFNSVYKHAFSPLCTK